MYSYIHSIPLPILFIFLSDIGLRPARRCCVNTSSFCQASFVIISLNGNSCEGYFMYLSKEMALKVLSWNKDN